MKDISLKELNKKLAFPMPRALYENLLSLRKGEKIRDMLSPNSEDALTWSLFRTFFHIADKEKEKHPLSIPAVIPLGSSLKINFKHTDFYVWNRHTSGKDNILVQRLNCVLERCEANPNAFSEIDGIIWDRSKEKCKLLFFENKLDSKFAKCGKDKDKKWECRRYRTSKRPEDNGCSYWGEGEGGDAFKQRFPRNLVKEYFKNFSQPKSLKDRNADCYKYYQLMRNLIVGKELARDIGADFTLVSIISKNYNYEENKEVWKGFISKTKDTSAMLLTWEDVLKAVEGDGRLRTKRLAKWLKDRIKR